MAKLTLNVTRNLPNQANTVILFNAVEYDPLALTTVATGRYTCPVAGYYFVAGNIQYSGTRVSNESAGVLMIFKNNAEYARGPLIYLASANNSGANVASLVKAAANDYLQLATWHAAGADLGIYGAAWMNYMTVHFVAPG